MLSKLLPIALLALSLPAQSGTATKFGQPGCFGQRIAAESANSGLQNTNVRIPGNSRCYIRWLPNANRTVTSFDLPINLTSAQTGTSAIINAYLYDANTNDHPNTMLASGKMGLNTGNTWRRASVYPACNVVAGKFYFLVLDVPAVGVTIDASTSSNRQNVAYFVKPNGGSLGAMQNHGLVYRINTNGQFLTIESVTPPVLGTVWITRCNGAPGTTFGYFTFATGQLPSFLADHPGSFLYGALDCVIALPQKGQSTLALFLPNNPALAGKHFTSQFAFETASNDWAISDALAVIL